MPVIPVRAIEWHELLLAVMRLVINPESIEATEDFNGEFEGYILGQLVKFLGIANLPIGDAEIALIFAADPNAPVAIQKHSLCVRDSLIAGQILVKALRLAFHMEERAS